MKTTIIIGSIAPMLACLVLAGCASSEPSAAYTSVPSKSAIKQTGTASSVAKMSPETLQGSWKGKEIDGNSDGTVSLKVEGNRFEFRGADENEWYKGTFTVRDDADPHQFLAVIADCPDQDFIGKTSKAIYRLQGGKLMLAARRPGSDEAPADFNDSESRKFELSR